jgi:hypothetical protein
MLIIRELLLGWVCLMSMFILHEFGHWLVLKRNKIPYKFSLKKTTFTFTAQKELILIVLFIGIFLGAAPLFMYAQGFNYPDYTSSAIIILYTIGCMWDIDQIIKILKEK